MQDCNNCSLALSYPYPQTSSISGTLVGNRIGDHSDVVGVSPVGTAPTTSSFSTEHLASIDCVKTTVRRNEIHNLSFGIWCDLYKRFDSTFTFFHVVESQKYLRLKYDDESAHARHWNFKSSPFDKSCQLMAIFGTTIPIPYPPCSAESMLLTWRSGIF